MTLDDAIMHCLKKSKTCARENREDYLQFAQWLAELRTYRKLKRDMELKGDKQFTPEEVNLLTGHAIVQKVSAMWF